MGSSQETIDRASRLVGTLLRDKWKLDALIGVGGMAAVYSATHRNGKRAAIKILNRDLSEGDTTRARFLREGYVANKVGHPGVVSVLDDDTSDDGRAFLVMELLEGETLKSRWGRWKKRMPADEVLRITHAVLDVLAAAHDKGIIHRDIKPDNIFLTNDGVVKVLDFGIARLRETGEAADATRSSAMLGTPAFMAPEQARSRWEWVDARTDVWAVGATMFTSLTGHFVHHGVTVTELLVTAAMMPARPIRSLLPELSEGIAGIIDRALAFDQGERWPDARAMQVAVGLSLQTKGPASPTTQPMQQVVTNPTSERVFDGHSSAVVLPSPRGFAAPLQPESSGIGAAPAVFPQAITNPLTAPLPASITNPLTTQLPHSSVNPAQPAPTSPTNAPISQQPALLSQSRPGAMLTPLPGTIPQSPLSQSHPGLMLSPPPGPLPDPPGVSTLVAAATGSTTLAVTHAKPKTNPMVYAAVGGIFTIGLIAAFFIVRSGGDTANNETNAGTPPAAPIDRHSAAPSAAPAPSVAPVAEPTNPVVDAVPSASVAPADSVSTDAVKPSTPRQTNTAKPRTPPIGTKKRDPFDKY